MSGHVLPLQGSSEPWTGGEVTGSAYCVLAPNPSPWTLDGTNTWVLSAPGSDRVAVVDPGPADPAHRAAVLERARHSGRVTVVLLTHGHPDHAEGARALADEAGVPVRALDAEHRLGAEGLGGGDVVDMGGWRIDVVAAAGHSSDSVCLLHDGMLLTGDTVLGRGTSVVAWPDGRLGDYLDTLRRLQRLVGEGGVSALLPGHGPVLDRPADVIDGYLAHRLARLEEVRAVVASGVTDPRAVVETVYADVPQQVWPAAELSVRAQLDYLAAR